MMNRRTVLRGMLSGGAVALALPWLESLGGFGRGTARANAGSGFPLRFGMFHWGNGNNPDRWTPIGEGVGDAWQLSEQLAPLAAHKDKLAVVTGLSVKLPNIIPHGSGAAGLLSGTRFDNETFGGPSIDQIIAEAIGGETLFRSLQTAGSDTLGISYSGPNLLNPAESSPFALYERLFGATFVEPGGEAIVDPSLGLRQSVLDGVNADLVRLQARLSTADRTRLEQHLDGVRDLESRLTRLIEDPPSFASCTRPAEPLTEYPDIDGRPQVSARSRAIADLLAMALACDQTRVFAHFLTEPVADVLFPGATKGHHSLTHDEGGDQPQCNEITIQCIAEYGYLLDALRAIPEGDETLLDHCAVLCCSEISLGQTHSLDEMPLLVAGGACGTLAVDTHIRAAGQESASELMLTLIRAMGVGQASFGVDEAYTDRGFSAIEV